MTTPDLLAAFDKFKGQIDVAYERAREHLERGELNECQTVLASIARVHASSSMSLRSVLIRRGLLRGED